MYNECVSECACVHACGRRTLSSRSATLQPSCRHAVATHDAIARSARRVVIGVQQLFLSNSFHRRTTTYGVSSSTRYLARSPLAVLVSLTSLLIIVCHRWLSCIDTQYLYRRSLTGTEIDLQTGNNLLCNIIILGIDALTHIILRWQMNVLPFNV